MLSNSRIASLLVCLIPLCVDAQSDTRARSPAEAVEVPTFVVGDSWRYRRTDGFNGTTTGGARLTVMEVGESQVTFVSERARFGPLRIVTTKELNVLTRGAGASVRRFTPFYPDFSFPLAPGKTWSSNVTFPNQHNQVVKATVNGTVVGWENVSVPAGAFEALKLTVNSDYTVADSPFFKGQTTSSCWYVPSIGRCAKYSFRDWNYGYNEWYIDELVSFERPR